MMQTYPSIPKFNETHLPKDPNCVAFKKYDGSNVRFEWAKKRWTKAGSRTHLIDASDANLGSAITLFDRDWNEPIAKVLADQKTQEACVFLEFYGPNSFAGQHNPNDEMMLTLFDIHVFKRGILGPQEFLKIFGHLAVADVVHTGEFNEQFIADVQRGAYPVVEGIVAKGGGTKGNLWWARKVKTQSYLDKLKAFGKEDI